MDPGGPAPSARRTELLEAAYRYALEHGLADISLRPLAAAIGSSPRVLMFLFDNKDGLIRALLARARLDELTLLEQLRSAGGGTPRGLRDTGLQIWSWLTRPEHRPLLTLWVEGYARSLVEPDGAWAGFAKATVEDWLDVLAAAQPARERNRSDGEVRRTLVLAVLRGALLDLLATGDVDRATAAVRRQLATLDTSAPRRRDRRVPPAPAPQPGATGRD
jgi:AcrR family transcriptional regulator